MAKGDWVAAAVRSTSLASLGFWGGNQFYDSLLTDVAEEKDYDLVSGYGYSLGYLGGGLLFLVNVLDGDQARDVRYRGCERGGAAVVRDGRHVVGGVHRCRCCCG